METLKNRHHLLDVVQVAFLLTDVHSNILYANKQTELLFGYKRDEIEGQRIRILFLEEDLIYFLPNIVYLTLYKNGFKGEALLRQKDGRKIFAHLQTNSFKEEGEVFLTFSFAEIQRLKNLEKERLEAEHWTSLGRMVEEIAHQLRNPIVSIAGYASRLSMTVSPVRKERSYLAQILHETRRLETMIQQVEEYIQISGPVIQKEEVQEVVEEALQSFPRVSKKKEISVKLDTGGLGEEKHFFIDKRLVVKVLNHLLGNSMEAILQMQREKQAPTIRVNLFEIEEGVGISIADRGEGIMKKNLPLIFEPFFSTRPDHTGLGLTFVKRVMEKHGGEIRVESQRKKGTTVILSFPEDRRRRVRRELITPETS